MVDGLGQDTTLLAPRIMRKDGIRVYLNDDNSLGPERLPAAAIGHRRAILELARVSDRPLRALSFHSRRYDGTR